MAVVERDREPDLDRDLDPERAAAPALPGDVARLDSREEVERADFDLLDLDLEREPDLDRDLDRDRERSLERERDPDRCRFRDPLVEVVDREGCDNGSSGGIDIANASSSPLLSAFGMANADKDAAVGVKVVTAMGTIRRFGSFDLTTAAMSID